MMKFKNTLKHTFKLSGQLLGLVAVCAFISCSDQKDGEVSGSADKAVNADLEKLILKEEPVNAVDIFDLRKTETPGHPVTFTGKVLGAKNVFVDNRAMMTVGDPKKLTSCDLGDCGECETPWDVCCDDPEDIKSAIVTVQVLDASGNLIKEGLKGLAGIKELSLLTITGAVDKSSNKDNMVINATGVFVK